MKIRGHNVQPIEPQPQAELPKFHAGPYRPAQEMITLVLPRADVYMLTQLLERLAVESPTYFQVRDAVHLAELIFASAKEHGY